jgi:hypothetical protein
MGRCDSTSSSVGGGLSFVRSAVLAVLVLGTASGLLSVFFTAHTSSAATPMRVAAGSFTGDGADNRPIMGIGFQPDLVFVKCDCGQTAVVRTSAMASDASKDLTSTTALQADRIQSLDGDGFTVGTSVRVNNSGKTMHWIAMKAGDELVVGSYTGNGIDNRSITGVGFQPVFVATFGDANDSTFRPSTVSGDASYVIDGSSQVTNRIQALEADGFQVGTNANVNASSATYYYAAWKASPYIVQSTYTGDGTDDRNITGLGFQPLFVWVKKDSGSQAVMRPSSALGDLSFQWGATAGAADKIQAILADGFQVGANAQVNTSGSTYHYIAFQDSQPPPTGTPTNTPTDTPTNTATNTPTFTPTDTPTPTPTYTPAGPMRVATGSFTGNGADDRPARSAASASSRTWSS